MATNARHFARPNSEVVTALGSVGAWGGGTKTIATICQTTDVTNTKVLLGAGSNEWTLQVNADESVGLHSDNGGTKTSAVSRIVSGHWHLLAVTKATGTVTPRFHIYDYTTAAAMVHEDGSGTQADSSSLTNNLWIGQDNNSSGADGEGEIQVLACFGSVLSDGDIESLISDLPALEALSPTALWPLTQADVGTAVQDTIGTADQTSTSGTSVVSGNPDWSETAGEPPQEGRPDADTTTTGWTATPLYSKLADESDATVVTATLA